MSARDPTRALHIDDAAECIWRDGEKIGVPPKAFLVLRRLMERPGQLVTKNDLLEAVWAETFVTEGVLINAILQLRQALGDDPKKPRFIETVHRRGYRWIGPAASGGVRASPPSSPIDEVSMAGESAEFVGRAQSLAELMRCHARAAAGRRQLVLISGEPGIGKTALVDRFVHGLTAGVATPLMVGRGQCVESHGAGDVYRPLREAVEQLLRPGGEEIRTLFRKHAPSWLLSMPELSSATELETLRRNLISTTNESAQRELERAIEAASAEHTIVLVLEDLHWSDPNTIALLWGLVARRGPARLLIIGTYRSADAIAYQHPILRLKQEMTAKRQCVEVALDGLPSDAVDDFLDRHFPQHQFPPDLAMRLFGQTTGNPLFLLNTFADFEQRGWFQEAEGSWQCTVDVESISGAIPESTRELIAVRLDRLPASARELLEAASIVSGTFAVQTVAAASERSGPEVEAELEPLAHSAFFLRRGDDIEWPNGTRGCQYEFRHALYRRVLLDRITPARRQVLHRRTALALEGGYGDRVGEIAGALATHYEQAGDDARAVDYIEMLVRQAYARSAAHEAEAMLRHAVALLKRAARNPERQERLLKVTIAHGAAVNILRGATSAESLRIIEEARALGQSMPTSPERIAALGTLVAGKIFTGHLHEAHSLAQEILALAGADESPSTLITAHSTAGGTSMFLGQLEAALEHLQLAVASADLRPDPTSPGLSGHDPGVMARMCLAYTLALSGRPEKARTCAKSGVQLARTIEMPWYLGASLSMSAVLASFLRDPGEARQLATAALAYGKEKNLAFWDEMNQVVVGWADVLTTHEDKLIAPLRELIDTRSRSGDGHSSRLFWLAAEAYLAVDRIDDAERALDAAFDARREERLYDAQLLRLRAMIRLARVNAGTAEGGAREEVEQALEQAIEVANRQGTRLFGLRATVDLCRLWLTTRKRDQARARLTAALAEFDEGFGEMDLHDAQMLLDEIDRSPRA